ncbi:MAG: hypothetical protein HQ495_06850 [Alphaproteobacteria bacterium]|nr:hypothetical protein [Alphaproteobacteria bacterium]
MVEWLQDSSRDGQYNRLGNDMFIDPGHEHVEGDLKLLDDFVALAWSRRQAEVVVLIEHLHTRSMLDNVEPGKRRFYRATARFLRHVVRKRAKLGDDSLGGKLASIFD